MPSPEQHQQQWRPRKVPPPHRPVFPPSPPHSPEVVQEERRGQQNDAEQAVDEEDQLRRAVEASLQDKPVAHREESDDQLQAALAESRALEAMRKQRNSTVDEQEQADLHAAVLASQRDKPSAPIYPAPSAAPSSSHEPTLYRSRSASLPTFSPSDLAYPSTFPPEKARLFPEARPALPPGAGGAWDDESREMEMLALAIRISEEEEHERQRLEAAEEQALLEQVRSAEAAAMRGRGMAGAQAGSVETTEGTTSFGSNLSLGGGAKLSAQTSMSTGTGGAALLPMSEGPAKEKKRSSWFRPPLASKLSHTDASPPRSPALPPRPALQGALTSTTTVQSYRTAHEALPFSNLERLQPTEPSQSSAPKPTRLPPSPPETPHVSSAPFSRQHVAPPTSTPFIPSPSLSERERFRLSQDGSPFEVPYLTPSNSIRSSAAHTTLSGSRPRPGLAGAHSEYEPLSSGSGSGSGGTSSAGGERYSRPRTFSGATGSSYPPGGSNGAEHLANSEVGEEDEVSVLAIRNPDDRAASATPASTRSSYSAHSYEIEPEEAEEFPSADADELEPVEALWHDGDPAHPFSAGFPGFESAYAGRSMSAIDEMTEPASSVVGTEFAGEARQGSFPSTLGTGAVENSHSSPTAGPSEGRWLVGGDGGANSLPFASTSPTSIPHGSPRPSYMRRGSSSSSSVSASRMAHAHVVSSHPQSAAAGVSNVSLASTAPTSILAPSAVTPPPATAQLELGNLPLSPLPLADGGSIASHEAPSPAVTPPLAPEDGLRFGYPSSCARQPGHACPSDGLSGSGLPPVVELASAPVGVGLGLGSGDSSGADQPRDAWAVEARSWVALLRFLMWEGDKVVAASSADLSASPSGRCAATASLEFRPDDEGTPVLRLILSLLPPTDPASHLPLHRELSVSHTPRHAVTPPGKGKQRATDSAWSSSSATFTLPDVVHLPVRLSSFAIQLYTLRHLASIARATQPARSPPPPALPSSSFIGPTTAGRPSAEGYLALRALADSISALARAAHERDEGGVASAAGNSGAGGRTPGTNRVAAGRVASPPAEEQNQRLVDRLRARLRRLKHHGGDENVPPSSAGPSGGTANGSVRPPGMPRRPSKLVKPPPPPKAQPISRRERVLTAQASGSDGEEEGAARGASPALEPQQTVLPEERPRQRRTSTQSQLRYLPQLGR
ncbi:hypothetical protein JCM10213v2_002722 [Rhodosporidiobolus nylandii]